MKKLLSLILFFGAFAANVHADDNEKKYRNKHEHAKVLRHHQKHWNQPHYGKRTPTYSCYDSWGNHLRGQFSRQQQYFIELGGGECRKKKHRHHSQLNEFQPVLRYDFEIANIYRAINEIKNKYRLHQAEVVKTYNVDENYHTMHYTIAFNSHTHGYREFRVKHDRRNGRVKNIREV